MVLSRSLAVLVLFVAAGAFASDFQIGPDAQLDSLSISASAQNYLVVWRDLRTVPQMRGTLVSTTGISGADFAISDVSGIPTGMPVQRSRVASDNSKFLTVWADAREGNSVRGAYVASSGGVSVSDFLIAPTSGAEPNPQTLYSGASFVVAWHEAVGVSPSAGVQVRYCRVDANGVASAPSPISSSAAVPQQTLEFMLAGPNGETLLVIRDDSQSPTVTRAVRIAADDSVAGPAEGTALFTYDFSLSGYGLAIGGAFDGTEYIILSSRGAETDSSVFAIRFDTNNDVDFPQKAFIEVGQGTTDLVENEFPRTFFNGLDQFLFVRNDQVSDINYHLLTKRVMLDGEDLDPNLPFIDDAPRGVLNGAVAASIGNHYLVAWMDGRKSFAERPEQANIFGTFVNAVQGGNTTRPYLKAIAHASPIFGNAPLTVFFNAEGSTGFADRVIWDFGDGESKTFAFTSHQYTTPGIYTATLSIVRAGFVARDYVRIVVDQKEPGGGGGPPDYAGGQLGPVSSGVNPDVLISQMSTVLNFGNTTGDSVRIFGYMNVSKIPVLSKENFANWTIGAKSYSATLAANGVTVSANGSKPYTIFQLNRFSGAFQITTNFDNLKDVLAPFGLANETNAKPGKDVQIPIAFNFETMSYSGNISGKYISNSGKNGTFTYIFDRIGFPSPGFFHIFNTAAKETGVAPKRQHTIGITGNTGPGGNKRLEKAANGFWRVTMGDYSEAIKTSDIQVLASGLLYSYKAPKKKTGIQTLLYNTRSGAIEIIWVKVDAEGSAASGMAISTTPIIRTDMALSLDFDLSDGTQFQASGWARFKRKDNQKTKWIVR